MIKTAPLRGAGSGAPRAGLWPWRGPARRVRAVPAGWRRWSAWLYRQALQERHAAAFLAPDSPSRGRQVKGALRASLRDRRSADPGP